MVKTLLKQLIKRKFERTLKPFSIEYGSIKPFYGRTKLLFNGNKVVEGLIKVEKNASSLFKAYIIFHERIHEILVKLFSDTQLESDLSGFHDLIDYLVHEFKTTYSKLKNRDKGLNYLVSRCMNRYKPRCEIEEFYKKELKIGKQTKLADFKEFRAISKIFTKTAKQYNKLRRKLRKDSKSSKQTVLATNPKNKHKLGVV